jgi:hypothetical protein
MDNQPGEESSVKKPIRNLSLAIVASAALQISLLPIAGAQQTTSTSPTAKQEPSGLQTTGTPKEDAPVNQEAERAAHPITQGGTTGGTVNPGVSGDQKQHGYNGG